MRHRRTEVLVISHRTPMTIKPYPRQVSGAVVRVLIKKTRNCKSWARDIEMEDSEHVNATDLPDPMNLNDWLTPPY